MEDFLSLDASLGDEAILIRQSVRNFTRGEIMPIIADCYERAVFPQHLIKQFANLGLFGLTLPEKYGGSNASYVSYGLACQELEYGDSGIRSFISVQNSLCMYPIYTYGSEEQRQRWLPKMAAGEVIGCFGITEADAGSDPSSMQTTAVKTQGGWILNGSKLWITNATYADIAIIWAQTNSGIRGFIVDTNSTGFAANEIKHKMALRASNTGELVINNCFVPEENYLPGSDKGLSAALGYLTQARYGIAWGAIGAAMACYASALDYCKIRQQFAKPIATFQLIQKDLVQMFNEIVKAQALNLQIGQLKDQNKCNYAHVSLAKMNACKEALKIARMARSLLGANGISLEYPVIRHMHNLEAVSTYEGTDNIHHLIMGRYLTGISAFN